MSKVTLLKKDRECRFNCFTDRRVFGQEVPQGPGGGHDVDSGEEEIASSKEMAFFSIINALAEEGRL